MAKDEENRAITQLRDQFGERCKTLDGLIFESRKNWLGKNSDKTANKK